MPGDNGTVRVQSPNGQLFDLPRAQYGEAVKRGFKLYNSSSKIATDQTQFERENSPEPDWGFTPQHVRDTLSSLVKGTEDFAKDALDPRVPVATGPNSFLQKDINAPMAAEYDKAADLWKQGRRSEAVGHYVASNIPMLGPFAAQIGEAIGRHDLGGPVTMIAGAELGGKMGEVVGDAAKGLARYEGGAGKGALNLAIKENIEKNAAALAEHDKAVEETAKQNRSSLAASRDTERRETAAVEQHNAAARAKHSDAVNTIRKANADAQAAVRAGQDAEITASKLTDAVSQALPDIADAETAKAKAAYPKIEGGVQPADLYADLQTMVDDKLKGSGAVPSSLSRILADTKPPEGATGFGKSTGPSVGGRHFNLNDPADLKAYNNMKAQGIFTPEEIARTEGKSLNEIPFDDLHGMYSEMGRELYRGNLMGDAKAALTEGRKIIQQRMTMLAKDAGKMEQFQRAQRGWHILENVFRNTDPESKGGSPIARALATRDPITKELRPSYVRRILTSKLSSPVTRELLKHYPHLEDVSKAIDGLKRADQIAKSSPKVAKVKPEPTAPSEKPLPTDTPISLKSAPERPNLTTIDPEKWREKKLEHYAATTVVRPHQLLPWRLPYTIAQQLLVRMLSDPEFRRRIASDRPAKSRGSLWRSAGAVARKTKQAAQRKASP